MFQLGKTIVSEDIIEKEFVCNIAACKGKCCIDGEAGAPLEEEELKILLDIYPKIKPFLRDEGIAAIEDQGLFITNEGEYETPLINEKDCAYVIFDEKNISGDHLYGTGGHAGPSRLCSRLGATTTGWYDGPSKYSWPFSTALPLWAGRHDGVRNDGPGYDGPWWYDGRLGWIQPGRRTNYY